MVRRVAPKLEVQVATSGFGSEFGASTRPANDDANGRHRLAVNQVCDAIENSGSLIAIVRTPQEDDSARAAPVLRVGALKSRPSDRSRQGIHDAKHIWSRSI